MSIDTRGLDRIRNGLNGAIERGVVRAASQIADLASQLAPVRTGELRDSIHVEPGDNPNARLVVASAPHAAFVEYGTAHMDAQPYMTPAKEAIDVQAEVAAEVRRLIEG